MSNESKDYEAFLEELRSKGPSVGFYERLDKLDEPLRTSVKVITAQMSGSRPEDWAEEAGIDLDSFLQVSKELSQADDESNTERVFSIRVAMQIGWYMGALHERFEAGQENPYATACRLVLRVPTYSLEGGRASEASPLEKAQMIATAGLDADMARLREFASALPDKADKDGS